MALIELSVGYRKYLDLSKIGSVGFNTNRALVLLLVAISSILYPTKVNSQDNRLVKFETLVKEFEDSLRFNGVLLMADSLGTFYTKSVGYANYENALLHRTESKFRIASLSKMFVSYMIFILVDQGKLKLDDPLGELVPMLNTSFKEQITIRALLNHTSGLIRDIDKLSAKSQRDYFTTDEIIQLVNLSSLQSAPGSIYSYSNVGYSLLGIIIENVTGKKLNAAFQTLLGKPLHLTSSGHEEDNKVVEALSPGYDILLDEVYRSAYEDKSHVFAAGSFYSNVNDLAIFAREVIEGSLLSDSLHVHYLATTKNNRTEGAWITYSYRSDLGYGPEKGKFLTFSGNCPGYSSFLEIFLNHKILVAGLSNLTPINSSF